MEHYGNFLFLACGVVIVVGIVGLNIYATVATKARSYLVRQEGNTRLFRKPPALWRGQWAMFWFAALLTFSLTATSFALQKQDPSLFYIEGIGGTGLSSIILYWCGPDDIRLDAIQRTYMRTVGWPWKPKTLFGSFSDVKGVCINPQNTVLLLMKRPDFMKSSGAIVLSSYGTSQFARALTEELNRVYGFPIVPYSKM